MNSVLVLEDEHYTRQFISTLIEKHPLVDKVLSTDNSNSAIEITKEFLPSIALIDIELAPEDVFDGIQVSKIISAASPDSVIVFLTGYSKYSLASFAVHPYDYILKPIQKERLMIL